LGLSHLTYCTSQRVFLHLLDLPPFPCEANLPLRLRSVKKYFLQKKNFSLPPPPIAHFPISLFSPAMQPLLIAPDAHRCMEEFAQPGLGQDFFPRAIGHD